MPARLHNGACLIASTSPEELPRVLPLSRSTPSERPTIAVLPLRCPRGEAKIRPWHTKMPTDHTCASSSCEKMAVRYPQPPGFASTLILYLNQNLTPFRHSAELAAPVLNFHLLPWQVVGVLASLPSLVTGPHCLGCCTVGLDSSSASYRHFGFRFAIRLQHGVQDPGCRGKPLTLLQQREAYWQRQLCLLG